MKKVITTFAFGPQEPLLDVSLPTFRRYAQRHGYDLYVPAYERFPDNSRPYPWLKIPLALSLLESGYEAVVWIDADVAIIRFCKDILCDAGDEPMAMVAHQTGDGFVPNSGVWVIRRSAAAALAQAWDRTEPERCSCWWEQAALIAVLGGDPDGNPVSVPASNMWRELPYEWNPHVNDRRGIPDDCRFFHATMFGDRAAAMTDMIARRG